MQIFVILTNVKILISIIYNINCAYVLYTNFNYFYKTLRTTYVCTSGTYIIFSNFLTYQKMFIDIYRK